MINLCTIFFLRNFFKINVQSFNEFYQKYAHCDPKKDGLKKKKIFSIDKGPYGINIINIWEKSVGILNYKRLNTLWECGSFYLICKQMYLLFDK